MPLSTQKGLVHGIRLHFSITFVTNAKVMLQSVYLVCMHSQRDYFLKTQRVASKHRVLVIRDVVGATLYFTIVVFGLINSLKPLASSAFLEN